MCQYKLTLLVNEHALGTELNNFVNSLTVSKQNNSVRKMREAQQEGSMGKGNVISEEGWT